MQPILVLAFVVSPFNSQEVGGEAQELCSDTRWAGAWLRFSGSGHEQTRYGCDNISDGRKGIFFAWIEDKQLMNWQIKL